MAFAKQYYGCDDIEGVYLENEGSFGTTRLDEMLYHDKPRVYIVVQNL